MNQVKTIKVSEKIEEMHKTKIYIFLNIHKMHIFFIKPWNKNGAEAIKDDQKKWINQKQFGNSIGHSNIAPITQYYSPEYK